MPTNVKTETAQDVQKIKTHTVTRQDFVDFEATEGVRSFRKETVDGVVTIVEEYLDLGGQTYSFQIDGTTSTEPLITHPKFKDIPKEVLDKWADYQRGRDVGNWKPQTETNTLFVLFFERYSKGFESYFSPRITIRMTGVESGPPSQVNVGKIDSGYSGLSLTVPSGVDFILTSARGTQEGDFWRNTYEWMGSSRGAGWDTEIYGGNE